MGYFQIWKLTHSFISHRCTLEWLSTHQCTLTFFTLWANSAGDDKLIFSKKKKQKKKNSFLFSGKNKKNISKCCMLNFVSADILNIFAFFIENRIWHFMQIVSKCQMFIGKNKLSPIYCLLKMPRVPTINFQQMTFLNSFLICFSGNWIWHIMYIVSTRDSLHEMSNSVGWKN